MADSQTEAVSRADRENEKKLKDKEPELTTIYALVWRILRSPKTLVIALLATIVVYVLARVAGYDVLALALPDSAAGGLKKNAALLLRLEKAKPEHPIRILWHQNLTALLVAPRGQTLRNTDQVVVVLDRGEKNGTFATRQLYGDKITETHCYNVERTGQHREIVCNEYP